MKIKRRRLLAIALIAISLFLLFELLLRPKVISQSLASMLYKTRNYAQAEKIFNKNAGKGDAKASANLAKSLYKQEKYQQAEEPANNARNLKNKYYDLGNISYRQGDFEKAAENFKRAMLDNPNDTDAKANYELSLKQKDKQAPKPEPKEDPNKEKQEEIRNILGGLDNKESNDRKQQQEQGDIPLDKWW